MKKRASRRIAPSSGYIGAGNKTAVFSRKARKPFEQVADIYKEKVKDNGKNTEDYRKAFKSLSEDEKRRIKFEVIKERKRQDRRRIVIALLIAGISLSVLFLVIY